MSAWIIENIATIIICAVLIGAVTLIVLSMRNNKKKGKSSCCSSCGSGCAGCPMACSCGSGKCRDGTTIPRKASK